MPTIILVNIEIHQIDISLLAHVLKGSIHQPSNGKQFGDSPRGSSPKGPTFDPHAGSFEWPSLDPCMHVYTTTCGINHLLHNMYKN